MSRYYLVHMQEQNGEIQYTRPFLVKTDSTESIDEKLKEIASTFYGDHESFDEERETYFFYSGEISVYVGNYKEIDEILFVRIAETGMINEL